jgi:hypothetical protein
MHSDPWSPNQDLRSMHQYNIRAMLERITIDIAKILPKESEDYFSK